MGPKSRMSDNSCTTQMRQIRRENKTFNLERDTKAKPTSKTIIIGHNQVNERPQPHKKLQDRIF